MQFLSRLLSSALLLACLVGCGGTLNTTATRSGRVDALAYVPDDAIALLRIDLEALRSASSIRTALNASFPAMANDPILARCDSITIAFDASGGHSSLIECASLRTTELEVAILASFGPDTRFATTGTGIAIVGDGMTADGQLQPTRRASQVASTMRTTLSAAGSRPIAAISFVPDDAMRESFVDFADSEDARPLLRQLADGLVDIAVTIDVADARARSRFVATTRSQETAALMLVILRAMGTPEEDAPSDEEPYAWVARSFAFRLDGSTVTGEATIDDLAAQIPRLELLGSRGEEVEGGAGEISPVAPNPLTDALAQFDYAAVIREVEPSRDALVRAFPTEGPAWDQLSPLFQSYVETGRSADAIALADALDASVREAGEEPPPPIMWFVRVQRGLARRLVGNYAGAVEEFEAALAIAGVPGGDEYVHSILWMALAELGRADEALAALDSGYSDSVVGSSPDQGTSVADDELVSFVIYHNNRAWLDHLLGRPAPGIARIEALRAAIDGRSGAEPIASTVANTYGALLFAAGRFEDSARAHRDEIASRGLGRGVNDPERALGFYSIAQAEAALHHGEKAVRYARQAVALLDRVRTRQHPETALSHLRLAQALFANGEAQEGHAEAALAVELFRASTVPTHRDRLEAETFLASHR